MYNNSFIALCTFITFDNPSIVYCSNQTFSFSKIIQFLKSIFNIIFKLLLTFKLTKLKNEKEMRRMIFQGCRFRWDVAGVDATHGRLKKEKKDAK